MKMKGINPFEQHAEKIVVGAMVVVFLAVVAMQFLLQPNRVKVGNQSFPPQDAYRQIENDARSLDAKLNATQPELPRPDRGADLGPAFEKALRGPVADSPRLAGTWPRSDISAGEKVEDLEGVRIARPEIPAPGPAVAYAHSSAIDPFEVLAVPDLAPLLPAEQPFDKAAVSVEATFDGRSLAGAFSADPDGESGPLKAMPTAWWRGLVEILGVRLEREELSPTGEWTNLTTVPPAPGRADLLATLEQDVARTRDMEVVVRSAAQAAAEVRRPAYYRAIAGPEWLPPAESIARDQKGGARAEIERKLNRRAGLENSRARVADQLQAAGGAVPQPRGPGGGGKGVGRQPAGQQQPDSRDRTVTALQRRLEQLDEDMAQVNAELAALGYSDDPNAAQGAPGEPQGPELPALDSADIRLWAHDLTAEPGKTYRYRVLAVLNNPIFGRGPALHAEQRTLADSRTLLSEPSRWSAPVRVDPMEAYFVVSASEGGEGLLGGTRATAELYRRYYGYWRKGMVNLEPGDRLRAEMRLPKDLYFVDTARLAGGEAPPGTPVPPPMQPPTRGTPQPAPPGPPGPGRGAPEEPEVVLEPWQLPAPQQIEMVLDTVFLDASRVPAGTGSATPGLAASRFQAILRGPDGRLIVKTPEDRAGEFYARVTESARDGETQGRPEPELVKPPTRPEREPDPYVPAPSSGGGGGGGGGGG